MPDPVQKPVCGIVMPISAIDGCTESHWGDVIEILTESIESAGFDANIVSNADDVGIIHKRIIQNLYDNPMVVCDVSGKNPNVMFELDLRLAFDKPTVIVKDDKTAYTFDTSAIEHLEYPRDLRFSRIVDFKKKLSEKIAATHLRATTDSNYTTFLKHFGEFTVAKLDKKEVSRDQYILEELQSVRGAIRRLEYSTSSSRDTESPRRRALTPPKADLDLCLIEWSEKRIDDLVAAAKKHPGVLDFRLFEREPEHKHMLINLKPGTSVGEVEAALSASRISVRRPLKADPGAG